MLEKERHINFDEIFFLFIESFFPVPFNKKKAVYKVLE